MADLPLVISYSDGEGAMAGIGCAIWAPGEKPQGGYMRTPASVRRLWSRQKKGADAEHDIYEIEALGPVLVLATWPHLLKDRLWIHFIDNSNALAALVKGGSSVHSADVIAAWVSSAVARLGAIPWYDRVDTKSNPVDGLSRGRLEGPWELVQLVFPPELRDLLVAYLDE